MHITKYSDIQTLKMGMKIYIQRSSTAQGIKMYLGKSQISPIHPKSIKCYLLGIANPSLPGVWNLLNLSL